MESGTEGVAPFGVGALPRELDRISRPALLMPLVVSLMNQSWGWLVAFVVLQGTGSSVIWALSLFTQPPVWLVLSIRLGAGLVLGGLSARFAATANRRVWDKAAALKTMPARVAIGPQFASVEHFVGAQSVFIRLGAVVAVGTWLWLVYDEWQSGSQWWWTISASIAGWALIVGWAWMQDVMSYNRAVADEERPV